MFSGIKIPKFSGKRKKRILHLLEEAEKLSSKELEREEVFSRLLLIAAKRLKDSEIKKVEERIKKQLHDEKNKERILISYFKELLPVLKKLKDIICHMIESNKKLLENTDELRLLVEEHNKNKFRIIPRDEIKFFLEFQEVCNKKYEERKAIAELAVAVLNPINNMIRMINRELRNLNLLDEQSLLEFFKSEKQNFIQVIKLEVKKFPFEVKSLDDATALEELNQVIFDRKFLNQVRYGRKITKWNKRIRRIAFAYVGVYYLFLQIALPTGIVSFDLSVKKMHNPEVYKVLQQESRQEFRVKFSDPEGSEVTGIFVKNYKHIKTSKAMLLVHGKGANATQLLPYVQKLRTMDLDFLSIDLRTQGPGFLDTFNTTQLGLKEALDVVGGINYLASKGYSEVVVYGYSIGGAATLNALAKFKNYLSPQISIKGIIIEKTFSDADLLLTRSHKNLFNLGPSLYRTFIKGEAGEGYSNTRVLPPTDFQTKIVKKCTELISGYKLKENSPVNVIGKINAPILLIYSKSGDIFAAKEDMELLAKAAKNAYKLPIDNNSKSLSLRHAPEFNKTEVIAGMASFIQGVIQ
ncbi:MAG: hypothetical protein HQ538_07165 [Parcubacteria group bacterium]|nr:hypothetical protein [Parcubacteria group bacterium]